MEERPTSLSRLRSLLLVGMWIGVATGLIEGVGLILFQRINWERWGPMIHVSAPILWISPLVDVLLFSAVALLIGIPALFLPRFPAMRIAVVVLVAFAAFDWLTLTGRLTQRSCLLLGLGAGVAFGRWFGKREPVALQFWKRTLPWLAAAAILAFISVEGGRWLKEKNALAKLPPAAPGAPNVLLIVVDTLRADHLSSYGYAKFTSPNFDRLAGQGVLFENAVSASSWTFPSHVSLVTGHYPFRHGMDKVGPVPLFGGDEASFGGYPTIGQELEKQGYRTGAFSANRTFFTGNLGFSRGFTHFEDYFYSAADRFDRTLLGGELMRIFIKNKYKDPPQSLLRYGKSFGVRKRADEVNAEVLRWIDRGGDRPFFAFLNYLDVHDPYGKPQSIARNPWDKTGYDDGVKYVDDYIGRLMQDLERKGLTKNTLVILTSDHGESLGEHGLEGHGRVLYWGLIHVPLAIWFPGHVPEGVRITRPVTNTAIAATILDLLGAHGSETFSGPPLSLLWEKPESAGNWPDPVSEQAEVKHPVREDAASDLRLRTAKNGPMKSVVSSRWHLIVHKNLGDQLYDWIRDPAESNNLIGTHEGQKEALLLNSQLRNVLARSASSEPGRPLDSATSLQNGTFDFRQSPGKESEKNPVNDYYRISADGGEKVIIQVRVPQQSSSSGLDPVLTIEDAQGELLQTCLNPGDDHVPPPGVADATPEAYDDVCVNDDIEPGAVRDSKLELKVPTGSQVDLYLHISDWNGRRGKNMAYQIAVSGAKQDANGVKPVGQQVDSKQNNHKN